MKTKLNMKCKSCGHWNKFEVEKVFSANNPEPKVQVLVPQYLPYREEKCSKCGNVIAEEKTLVRITPKKGNQS